jgi:hypothetical protein
MAQIPAFNPTEIEPEQAFTPIPPGEYIMMITDSEMRESSRHGNYFLILTMTVVDGEHKGRKVFDRLNLVNSNPKAVEIATRRLSAICHAAGFLGQLTDSVMLHNIPVSVVVTIVEDPGYAPKNEVKGYMSAEPASMTQANNPQAAQQAAAAQSQQSVNGFPPGVATQQAPTQQPAVAENPPTGQAPAAKPLWMT